jgi:hypothetical protein
MLALDHTYLIFTSDEAGTLNSALAHYRAHRKAAEASDADEPAWAQDAQIEQVRRKLWSCPPDGSGPAAA